MAKLELSVIIVSWNVKDYLVRCIDSLLKHDLTLNSEIIVVDNASEDGTVELIDSTFPDIKVIRNEINLGFSKANNIGLKNASGRFVVFLNPDTLLIDDSLSAMGGVLKNNSTFGAVGCKLIDENNNIDFHCAKNFPTISNLIFEPYFAKVTGKSSNSYTIREWDHRTNKIVDVLSGACLMVRRKVLESVGYFDETIFMYVDDVDLCYRIKKGGWELYYLADTAVIHYGQQSTRQRFLQMNAESVRSMRKYFSKHKSHTYAWTYEILTIIEYLSKSILLTVINLFKSKHPPSVIRDYRRIAIELLACP